jgi:hypothetical protein
MDKKNNEFCMHQLAEMRAKIEILENVSRVLGVAHAGITAILDNPDIELRSRLEELKHRLDIYVNQLFEQETVN